ncbi:MAG: hypothetical protein HN341_10170 [Verrucomicrobia bacterium]|nr:hypothetical protein [Verrucomicrobiota bacterium]
MRKRMNSTGGHGVGVVCRTVCVLALFAGTVTWADVHWDGLYHNNTNLSAEAEQVPVVLTAGVTNRFLEVDYANNRVNLYFLMDHPAADGSVSCRARFHTTSEGEEFEGASWQTNAVLTDAAPFHGTPVTGSYTVEVWKVTWQPPNGFTGTVYYAPQILEVSGTDIQSLVRDSSAGSGGEWGDNSSFWQTNAQHIAGGDPSGADYSFAWTNSLPLEYDWFYFNDPGVASPASEMIPGLGGTNFFEYSYDPDVPSYIYFLTPQGGLTSARSRLWFANDGAPGEVLADAEWFTNVELGPGLKVHELPTTGSVTVDVWRTPFYAPNGWGDGDAALYHATELTVPKNGKTWMTPSLTNAAAEANVTNALGQLFTTAWPGGGREWISSPTGAMDRAENIEMDWAYHNNTSFDAQLEAIPGQGAVHFVAVDHANSNTTFYLLLNNPGIAKVPGESAKLKTRVYNSHTSSDIWLDMSWAANASPTADAPFHGLPVSGSKWLDVWKAVWTHPTNAVGESVTNQFDVYYTFELKTLAGSLEYETDVVYLTKGVGTGDGWSTNNYTESPQFFGPGFHDEIFQYSHQWRDEGDDDGDGMPNWWEAAYLGGATNGLPGGNDDMDELTNLEEWTADTLPNDSNSVYMALITDVSLSNGVFSVQVGPGTSTQREYDLLWKTNLLDTAWTPVGFDAPGAYDGGILTLGVGSSFSQLFLKSEVKLP